MMRAKIRTFSVLLLLLVSLCALSGAASALSSSDVGIDWVKIDGDELEPGLTKDLYLERDNTFEIKVMISSNDQDLDNLIVEATVTGDEHDDRFSDITPVFDLDANKSVVKKLTLQLPARADKGVFDLKVRVEGPKGTVQEYYSLEVVSERHSVEIKDVNMDPASTVQAGRSIRALVDLRNYGEKDEEDVKIEFEIPELGLAALPDYMDVEDGKAKVSEELWLRVPACTEEGRYEAVVTVTYDDGDETVTKTVPVTVVESPDGLCGDSTSSGSQGTTPSSESKTVITVGSTSQEVKKGEGGAIYPITFTNTGSATKTFVVAVTGADDWATVRVSPLQTVVLGGDESKSVYVYVSAKETAQGGEHMFSVDVKDSDGNTVKQLPFTASVVDAEGASEGSSVKRGLEIGLIVLVVLLIILGLIVAFTRRNKDDEEDEDEITGQTYY